MVGSIDTLDFVPDLSFSEKTNAIPIDCWQNVYLPKIWIPKHLLPSRTKPSNSRDTQGIYHRLQKKDHAKCIESFSVYSDSDVENELEEIFLSDSNEDDLDIETFSSEENECHPKKATDISTVITASASLSDNYSSNKEYVENDNSKKKCKNRLYKNVEEVSNFCKLKSLPSLSNLSTIKAEECTEFASSFGQIMNSVPSQYKGSNIAFKNYQKKENLTLNTFEHCDGLPDDAAKSEKHDKIINTDEIQNLEKKDKDVDSRLSLHEILDTTTEINMQDFVCDFAIENEDNYLGMQEKMVKSDMKKSNKKDKKKKKALKSVTLDQFLEDYSEEDRQEDYCNDYLQKILSGQNKVSNVQIRSKADFPDLTPTEFKFIHSEKSEIKSDSSTRTSNILTESDEVNHNENVDNYNTNVLTAPEITSSLGKIVIENIPSEAKFDDIYSLVCGYGEIKDFSLEPDGDFLKASIEIDLMTDIDWIIECLNGTEPFGASSKMLKCYKQQ